MSAAPQPTTAHRATPENTPSSVRRWWQTKVAYPDPAQPFRPTSQHDLLRSMRLTLRLMTTVMVLTVVVVVAAVAGWPLPVWTIHACGVLAVAVMMGGTPPARYAAVGMLLSSVRRRWSENWLDADVPLTRLWMMPRSPVPAPTFTAYARAMAGEGNETARLDGGTDPRLVWWLAGRGLTPDQVADYNAVGVDAVDAVTLAEADITPDDWAMLDQTGLLGETPVPRVVEVVDWVRSSRASLLPANFAEEGQRRPVSACVPVLLAWSGRTRPTGQTRQVRWDVFGTWLCIAAMSQREEPVLPCPACGGTEQTGHRSWLGNAVMLKHTVSAWVQMAGLLAPYFIAAKIGFAEAEQMLASENPPTVADLEFLAAWD